MMRIILVIAVFIISACSTPPQTIQTSDIKASHIDDAEINSLVAKINNEPTLNAIMQLRQLIAIRDKEVTNSFAEQDLHQALLTAIDASAWSSCLETLERALTLNYASIYSHYAGMVCHLESGQDIQSHYHQTVMNQSLEAIWQTGDGTSLDSAFRVINDVDKDAFIEFHGLEVIKLNIHHHDGQDFDIVTLYDAQKDESFEWYFTRLIPLP